MSSVLEFGKSLFGSKPESPPYDVLQKFENGIEERNYPNQKWAVTESESGYEGNSREMFFALFGYITGKNEKSQKISMTVPVSTKVEPIRGDKNKSQFCQMGFYVPKEFQQDTPNPTDPRVKIIERDLRVYVISYGGYRTDTIDKKKLTELLDYLKTKNLSVSIQPGTEDPIYYTVGYDAPHKFFNRLNEIWIRVDEPLTS